MDDYQLTVRALSDRIVDAQTPIRVLDAVKWDESVRRGFIKAKGRELPAVDRDYYLNRPLAFDATAKKLEFQNIER
ncbi:MAG: flavohemoglobin expression-modulating QEGLA motif protein, partial [Gammaproteobacteria bacterium]|nr:flavohemoglobin expression-modulating QEGLA motif protein [Gammaproteobacteria bacterium]